jgi:hypothetical protein
MTSHDRMSPPPAPAPRLLKVKSPPGILARVWGLLRRATPRAEVIAPAQVHLGERLAVEWRLDHAGREVTNVSVTLVGSEIARRRTSARTGITVVAETHSFLTYELDRSKPDRGAAGSTGHGSVVMTAPAVPTLAGRVNENAWAVVVEAAFQATAISRNEFPVVVLPMRPR